MAGGGVVEMGHIKSLGLIDTYYYIKTDKQQGPTI